MTTKNGSVKKVNAEHTVAKRAVKAAKKEIAADQDTSTEESSIKTKLGEAYKDFLTLQKMLQRQDANNIRFYHELGQKWSTCYKRYERNQGVIKQMTKYLGVDRTLIYDAQRFAERVEESELQAYIDARTVSGRSLTWSHVRLIIGASHKSDRLKAVEMVVDNNWSASQLNKFMTEVNEKKSNRKGNSGRKMRQPATVSQGVGMLKEAGEAFIRRYEEVFHPFISKTSDSITVEEVSEEMLNQFAAVLDQQRAIKQMSEDNINIISKIIDRIEELLVDKTASEEEEVAASVGGTVPKAKRVAKESTKSKKSTKTVESHDESTADEAAQPRARRRPIGV